VKRASVHGAGGIVLRRDGDGWRLKHGILVVAALVLPATMLHAALPPTADVSGPTSVTGQLLIATSALHGSAFEHAVILMAQHSKDGALGIVINRPLEERPIAEVLEAIGAEATGSKGVGGSGDKDVSLKGNVRIFAGGPVSPEVALVLHSADYHVADTLDIDGRVALTEAPDVLRDVAAGKGPAKTLVAFGYAGWSPLQLEDEIARGDWYSVPEDPALVFDDDRTKVWSDAMMRRKSGQ
jgi:putative transcriptional regulator